MEEKQITPEIEPELKESKWTHVTPLSKYLAITFLILMPFVGGWIGYHYSPEKVIETEKIVVKKLLIPVDTSNDLKSFKNDATGLTFTYPSNFSVHKSERLGEGMLGRVSVVLKRHDDLRADEIFLDIIEHKEVFYSDASAYGVMLEEIKLGDNTLKVGRGYPGMWDTSDIYYWEVEGQSFVSITVGPSTTKYLDVAEEIISSLKYSD